MHGIAYVSLLAHCDWVLQLKSQWPALNQWLESRQTFSLASFLQFRVWKIWKDQISFGRIRFQCALSSLTQKIYFWRRWSVLHSVTKWTIINKAALTTDIHSTVRIQMKPISIHECCSQGKIWGIAKGNAAIQGKIRDSDFSWRRNPPSVLAVWSRIWWSGCSVK